jgi:glyoxylase-like metal-dependent hydrolase (beta-lactamase superfamily II)
MKQIYPDLWQTRSEHPFTGVTTHAYLLVRKSGNVLIYSSGWQDELQEIQGLGGITHQYLSHRDEAGAALADIKRIFRSKLCCHEFEVKAVEKFAFVDCKFGKRELWPGDIEVIPTPGHTNGSVCFLATSVDGERYLFTGDTIFQDNGAWDTLVLKQSGGSKSDLKASLKLLRELEPTVVISSASVGSISYKEISADAWRSDVDNVLRAMS